MNKTLSIILIVVASIVVLGGTYWYFGVQKPKAQEGPTPTEVVQPAQAVASGAKERVTPPTNEKTDPPLPQEEIKQKQNTAESEEQKTEPESKAMPEKQEEVKPLPAPIAPSMTRGGGFALPSRGDKTKEGGSEKDKSTSVLAKEALKPTVVAPSLAVVEDTKKEPSPSMAKPALADEKSKPIPVMDEVITESPEEDKKVAAALAEEKKGLTAPMEEVPTDIAQNEMEPMLPVVEVEVKTVVEKKDAPAVVKAAATPPPIKILRSKTLAMEKEKQTPEAKASLEGNLSVSFLDYNFPKDFSSLEKSFTVSLDIMSQKQGFGWGGTLEASRFADTKIVQLSLLGKAEWKLGEGVLTFPLSISLGPTLFIDSTAKTTEFGMKAKLGAALAYAISDSFRIFYAVGVGATYNFMDNSSLHFVMEPIRVGVGFSF